MPLEEALLPDERDNLGIKRKSMSVAKLTTIMAILISLGCVNFLAMKALYTAYGDKRSFFVNQGVNLLYILYGGAILYPQWIFMGVVTPEMVAVPKMRFVIMGFLDALGTFCIAMGAVYTPGSMQPMLNQTLIPWIMLISRVYLKSIYRKGELAGAGLIIIGALTSALPPFLLPHSDSEMRAYAVFFYALSSVPMAMSSCYKEGNFQERDINVWYLTQYVSIFQFLLSFLFMPLQMLPGFGSIDGMSWAEIPIQFRDGFTCFLEANEECAGKGTFWLLVGYCGVNVLYNTLGLYLVQQASALMNALSFAILLPCTTLLFFTPLAGLSQETFSVYNCFTVVGLSIVLCGFALYTSAGREDDFEAVESENSARTKNSLQTFREPIICAHVHCYRHQHGGGPAHWHSVEHRHDVDEHLEHGHSGHQNEHGGHSGHVASVVEDLTTVGARNPEGHRCDGHSQGQEHGGPRGHGEGEEDHGQQHEHGHNRGH